MFCYIYVRKTQLTYVFIILTKKIQLEYNIKLSAIK